MFRKKYDGAVQMPLIAIVVITGLIFIISLVVYNQCLSSFLWTVKEENDFSNLAIYKYINQTELSQTGQIVFKDTDLNNAYLTYKQYLIKNLNLDINLVPTKQGYINSYVINKIIIYSFYNGALNAWEYDDSTHAFTKLITDFLGTTVTPGGRKVEHTGVYTELKVSVKMPFAKEHQTIIVSYTDMVNS